MNHTGFNHVAMNQARKVKGEQECQCANCGEFFTSTQAFDLHLNPSPQAGCQPCTAVLKGPASPRAGEPALELFEGARGPTWRVLR